MIHIKKILINLSTKSLLEDVKDYIKNNKCCSIYPNCSHPKTQSDINLLNDERFKELKEEIISKLLQTFKNEKSMNINLMCWAYWQEKGNGIQEHKWHDHLMENKENQVSFIIYLTSTNLGTLFLDENKDKYLLVPDLGKMYVWDSKYLHSPDVGKINEDRIIIAGSFGF